MPDKKIIIEFDKDLDGDVTGNESAFTVTAMQKNPLGIGALEQTSYPVISTERRPVAKVYEEQFAGTGDGVEAGANGLVLVGEEGEEESTITAATSQHSGSYPGLYARVVMQKDATVSKMQFKAVSAGTYTFKIQNSTGATTYRETTAVSAGDNTVVDFDISPIALTASTEYRFVFEYPSGRTRHTNTTFSGSLWACPEIYVYDLGFRNITPGMNIVTTGAYGSPGSHTSPPIDISTLPPDPRIKWTAETPTGTSITIEYATNDSGTTHPESWTAVADGDILTLPQTEGYFLWLKYTLETIDTAVTPTLSAVWLELSEQPQNFLLLYFGSGKFNNAEGDISVNYTSALGDLKGAGNQPVASFQISFTPQGLAPDIIPHHVHTISVGMTDMVADMIFVTYVNAYDRDAEHTISASITDLTVTLIHVDDINP